MIATINLSGFALRKSGLPLIHNTMITVNVRDCNQISQAYYDSVINGIQLHQLTCSCGHSVCLSFHAHYQRSAKTAEGTVRLRLRRVRCSMCGTTHALLISSLIPYSQIPLVCQHRICRDYAMGDNPYNICEENMSIDENNVKSVLSNYIRCWKEKLTSLRISLLSLTGLVYSCFLHYSSQFMQIHKGRNRLFPCTT